MTKPHDTWTVEPHGPLERLGDNLYTVTGRLHMPLGDASRRMTIARLADGRLVIYSPIALAEPEMRMLESLGTPAYMIVPRGNHRLDIKAWKKRYPTLVTVAPAAVIDEIREVTQVDQIAVVFDDPRVQVITVPGTGEQELAMMVTTETGKTLAVADLIFNLPAVDGVTGLGLKLLGFGPGHPKQPMLVKLKLVKDADAMKAQLQAWSELVDLERILPAHGNVIDNPREVLRDLAA